MLMFIISAIVSVILGTFTVYCTFYFPTFRTVKLFNKLPGPSRRISFIGVGSDLFLIDYADVFKWMKKTAIDGYEKLCAVWLIGLPLVILNDPECIETVLTSTRHIEKGVEYDGLKPWLKEGLLTSTGSKWHMRRKLLTPTFHFKILEDKSKTMYINARNFVDALLGENGRPFDAFKKISSCTLDVISEAAMGVTLQRQDSESLSYVAAIGRITSTAAFRVMNLYLRREWLWELTPMGYQGKKVIKTAHDFTNKIIAERKAVYSKEARSTDVTTEDKYGAKKRQAFLDKLLELSDTVQLTDSDIREEVDTFLFEGHDTTAACIYFAMFELGHNIHVQEMAYKEQFEIFGDDSREATFADLQNMNYLERVIKECLRLYPSVPYISRMLNEDLHLKDSTVVPVGSNVVIAPFFVHRNVKYFPDPEKFDPDRFLPDECAKRHPFSYIPFSAGPRNCIGQKFAMMELKVLLSTFIRFAKVESVTDKSQVHLAPLAVLRAVDPVHIRVLPRNRDNTSGC